MKKEFPSYGIFGILLIIVSEILLFQKVDPFSSWFYCFAWWSYILILDAVIYYLKANSLIINRTKEFFLLIPWSIFIWLIFEAANLSLENWYYIYLPHSMVERWLGYGVAYATVLPAIFETTELLETLRVFKNASTKRIIFSPTGLQILIAIGTFCLITSLVIPQYFFSLIWLGFTFLLEPFLYRFGGRSLLRDLEDGKPRKIYLLLIAGLVCGFLWEFWNYWARSKWIYTVPFFEELKGFEMPFLGFLGFPPFAVQAYVMYNFVSLFRYGRGWEEAHYRLHPQRRTTLVRKALTTLLIGSFCVLVFKSIDSKTVDSFYPRIKDAYWIEFKYRNELPKIGVSSFEDLIQKTRGRREKEELALRLSIPKEKLISWIERAKLAELKGIGVENLRSLEAVGIHSILSLASENPDSLYIKMERILGPSTPKKAKLKIWIREARRKVCGDSKLKG
jgi:hypothetical protein